MVLHTARVAPEKLTSHQPAAVHFCGVSKGIDLKKDFNFIVGDCAEVKTATDVNGVILTFLAWLIDIDGKGVEDFPEIENVEIATIGPISPEEAYLLGKALLMAAKINGVSE